MISVSVGVLRYCGLYLIQKRPVGKPYPNYWEFPGGKIDSGETPKEALCREFKEEVALDVLDSKEVINFYTFFDKNLLHIHMFEIQEFKGEVKGEIDQEIIFASKKTIATLDFICHDKLIFNFL